MKTIWLTLIGLTIAFGTSWAAVGRPAADLAVVGSRIYVSPESAPIEDGVVIIRNGLIARVGRRSEIPITRGIRVIDARGAVLTAGFWNNHVHLMIPQVLSAATAKAEILQGGIETMLTRWGFTTVFDIASSTDNALALRRRVDSGEIAGPMILTVGDPFFPKDGTPIYVREYLKAHGWPDEEVSTPEEAGARAARQLDRGTDGVKIFAGAIVGGKIGVLPMRLDIAKAVVDEAHRRGKPAFAHPSNLAGLKVATESGVDILAHTTAGDGGDTLGEWPHELVARMRARNMALIPTMTLFEVEAKKSGEKAEDLAWALKTVTGEVRDYSKAGGQILFGTDVGYIDVFDTTEEYRLMSSALDWRQILTSLTTAPAARFGFAAHKGRIAVGMDADLVILNADPAQDPTAFAEVRDTIRAGRVIFGKDGALGTEPAHPDVSDLQRQVEATERAFAKTMADRDHTAFTSFLSGEAVFFSGPTPLRGKQQVAQAWKQFYDKPDAPFSWEPEKVEVLDSGTLALSTGPVHDPTGKLIGRFTSIWRLEAPGKWRIVFDKGCDVCQPCSK